MEDLNKVWSQTHPSQFMQYTEDPTVLAARVRMLGEELRCAQENFRVTNKAYADLDRKLRGFRNYWWQFWRKP